MTQALNEAMEALIKRSSSEVRNFEQLKRVYRKLALSAHPDKAGNNADMQQLNGWWSVISQHKTSIELMLSKQQDNGGSPCKTYIDPIESDPLAKFPLPAYFSRETLLKQAFEIKDSIEFTEWCYQINVGDTVYVRDLNIKLHLYQDSMFITELQNSQSRDVCRHYTVCWNRWKGPDLFQWVHSATPELSLSAFIKLLQELQFETEREKLIARPMTDIVVYRSELKGCRVFSPFNVADKFQALKVAPVKLTVLHLMKALANGQYRSLVQSYRYTDDYAYDAASDFGKGVYHNPFSLLRKIVEDRSGLRVYGQPGVNSTEWSFGFHSNDGKQFIFELNNRFPAFDLELQHEALLA